MQPYIQTLPDWVQFSLLIVPAVSTVFTALTLLLNFYQSRRTNAQNRAALVAACLKGFADDEEIQRAFYAIEDDEFKYDDTFHKSDKEREVDKLLRHFSNVALAWKAGLVFTADIRSLKYYVLRVERNTEIQKYLAFIAQWSKEQRLGEHPYAVFSQLAEALTK